MLGVVPPILMRGYQLLVVWPTHMDWTSETSWTNILLPRGRDTKYLMASSEHDILGHGQSPYHTPYLSGVLPTSSGESEVRYAKHGPGQTSQPC